MLTAQIEEVTQDSLIQPTITNTVKESLPDHSSILQDSLGYRDTQLVNLDTLTGSLDSLPRQRRATYAEVNTSDDALDIPVNYGAKDTQWYDHKLKQMHLFGEAYVNYGNMALTAGYIVFNIETNEAEAFSIKDEEGHEVQKPKFKDGDQEFNYDRLRYNFETNKGLVYQAVTAFTDLYILGAKTKFLGAEEAVEREDDVIYNSDALITSCNHEHPHFGIRTKKLKVIPKKVGVTGPAQLEIGGVPTPLWLPFGFFPLAEGRSTGLLFPKNFPYQAELGFGVEQIGWYFPINDYMDLQLTADYYTRGTWGARSVFRYKKRYKFSGNFEIDYRDTKNENELLEKESTKSFSVDFRHNQDSKAHPFRSLGGNIQFSTNLHNERTNFDPTNVLRNQYQSNFYFKHKLPGLPYSLDLGLKHRQNTQTRRVDLTLPDIRLTMQTIYPFKRKEQVGNERWYEKINMSGSTRAANFVESSDSTLFTRTTLDNMRSGVKHSYSANVNLKFLKYFSANPNVKYNEDWVFNTLDKEYHPNQDSISTEVIDGFASYRTWSAGVNVNTALFGTILSNKGWFRGIRHTMKPNVGYSYRPDSRSIYQDSLNYNGELVHTYNRFEKGPFGSPSFNDLTQAITFGATNVVEMKYWSKKHEEERKFKLINQLNINGGYNYAADSLKWNPVSISGNTSLLKNLTNLRFSFTLDPYLQDGITTINKLVATERFLPVRLARGSLTLNSGITISKLMTIGKKESEGREDDDSKKSSTYQNPKLLDLIGNFRIDHNLVYNITSVDNQDSIFLATHTLGVRGRIKITDNWNIGLGSIGYDFKNKSITYPYLTFTRKLHCWNMTFNWAPSSKAFGFLIGVNSGTLDFLKYNYGTNNINNGLGGRLP